MPFYKFWLTVAQFEEKSSFLSKKIENHLGPPGMLPRTTSGASTSGWKPNSSK